MRDSVKIGNVNSELPNPENLKKELESMVIRPCETVDDLKLLNLDWNNLNMRIFHSYKLARIAYQCNTQDEVAKQNYHFATNEILPIMIRFESEINKKIVTHSKFEEVKNDYPIYYKQMEVDLSLFREENIPLHLEDEDLSSQYDGIIGNLKCDFRGQILPYQALSKHLESGDREERKEAFLAREKAFLAITENLDELFLKMLRTRHQMAANAGYKNYRDYRFQVLKRFDYTEKDCFDFHEAIEKLVVPMMSDLSRDKEKSLGLDRTRPWDLRASSSLKTKAPFETSKQLIEGCRTIFKKLDPELHSFFEDMISKKTLDLDVREGKAGGGFCSDLPMEKTSFIFMNATGTRGNVETLLHEAGHAFHNYLAGANVSLYGCRHSGSEFAEVASMSMELLARPYLDVFYSEESLPTIFKDQLVTAIDLFPLIAMLDAFQHWVYTGGENGGYVADPVSWRKKWLELEKRFNPYVDWGGHERYQQMGWQYLHVFKYPFYFVEYGIAQIGAFTVWANSLNDPQSAISAYKKALKLGGTRPLPQLFEAIGAKFGLDEKTLKPVLDTVKAHLN